MSLTVVVTRNVRERFRGFLASVMCEIAPGVYTAPRMNKGIRKRVWHVLEGWWTPDEDALVVMTWPDSTLPGGQDVRVLGESAATATRGTANAPLRRELVQHYGVYLARTPLGRVKLAKLHGSDPEVPF